MYFDLGISVAERTRLREEEILSIINDYWKKYNYSPTIREIAKKASVTSTSTVLKYLNKLQENGFIEWQQKTPRAIKVINCQRQGSAS
jgi:repressor LexA